MSSIEMSPSRIALSPSEMSAPRRFRLIDVSLLVTVTLLVVWALLL